MEFGTVRGIYGIVTKLPGIAQVTEWVLAQSQLAITMVTINCESWTKEGSYSLEYFQKRQVGWHTSLFIEHLLNSKPRT